MSNYSGPPLGTVVNDTVCSFCGPANISANCSNLGPEWSYNGAGSCGSCNFNCVNLGAVTPCTIGAYNTCKKTKYLGDLQHCCIGTQPTGYPKTTCDPSINFNSPQCSTVMQNYCALGENIFALPICTSWAAANPDLAFNIKAAYCTQNNIWDDSNCRSWVQENQGKLDSTMVSFCKQYPTDPLCSCVNSEIPCPNKFDTNCIQNGGYETADMIQNQCPNVMNCTQFLSLSPGAQALATNVEQNCSSTINTGSSSSTTSTTNNAGTSSLISLWNNHKVLIIILLIILVIVVSALT